MLGEYMMKSPAKPERHLGQFELLVLLAVHRLGPSSDPCLARITRELDVRTSRWISVGNVFASLKSLTKKRCLYSRVEDLLKLGPGRKSKCLYRLTRYGQDELNLALRDIYSMADGLELWCRVDQTEGREARS